MAATFKLPKKDYDQVIVVNTPLAADAVLAAGKLTLKDEAGTDALALRLGDLLSGSKNAYAAGTAHKRRVDLTNISKTANTEYRVSVEIPNRQDFFLYGKETNPLVTLRTYAWYSGTTAPTAEEVVNAFVALINADLEAGVTASKNGTDDLDILADSADAGELRVIFSDSGATYADAVAYVAPVGTLTEVELQAPGKSLAGTTYNRYDFKYRKLIKHNAVSGLSVFKDVDVAVYEKVGSTAYEAVIDDMLAGAITIDNTSAATVATTVASELAKYLAF